MEGPQARRTREQRTARLGFDCRAAEASLYDDVDRHTDLKVELHHRLLDLINLSALEDLARADQGRGRDLVAEQLAEQRTALNLAERKQLTEDVLDELLGLGPLEPLLKDPTITDILVNGHANVFVERQGRLERTRARFKDDRHLIRIIQKIVSAVGRRVDESAPLVDARLADGSRVNAVVPPLAVDGPLLSIRKFAKIPINLSKLIEIGSVPAEVAQVLEAIVRSRRNVVISSGTGSGKTTLLNAMSAFIDDRERIVTIEDLPSFSFSRTMSPGSRHGRRISRSGEVAQRELVKNALRMRPDRIIVGEVRAGEAFDMLQAMNTGHDGSMTTVHANAARRACPRRADGRDERHRHRAARGASADRLGDQCDRPGRTTVRRPQEAHQPLRDRHGRRSHHHAGDLPLPADRPQRRGGVIGLFEATGIRPKFCEHLETHGIHLAAGPVPARPEARHAPGIPARPDPGDGVRRRPARRRGRAPQRTRRTRGDQRDQPAAGADRARHQPRRGHGEAAPADADRRVPVPGPIGALERRLEKSRPARDSGIGGKIMIGLMLLTILLFVLILALLWSNAAEISRGRMMMIAFSVAAASDCRR